MNNPYPSPHQSFPALERYRKMLNQLTDSSTISEKEVLDILRARDILQKELKDNSLISLDTGLEVIEADKRLKQQAYKIVSVVNLADYRESFLIDDKAWWWNLDSRELLHPLTRFDGLWRVIKLILLGVNFTLIGTIATHFLSGSSGIMEIGGIIFTTFISLLQAQNELTQSGKNLLTKLMKVFKIQDYWYEQIQLGITFAVLLLLLGIWGNFSFFSEIYKNKAVNYQEKQEFVKAQQGYLKAIELDSDNLDAHFKLATLYEDLQDINQAKKHYLIAAKGGLLEAYNNFAYWYLRDGKYSEAVELLETGIKFLAEKDANLNQLSEDERKELAILRYSLYKNLGWGRLKQERYQDAIPNLLIAIAIVNNPDYKDYIRGSGAVYCLYAQVLEKTDQDSPEIKKNWHECERLISERKAAGDNINAEEDQWLFEAREKLNKL